MEINDINPRMLKWAREKAGYTPEEAGTKLRLHTKTKSAEQRLQDLEMGVIKPTYSQLLNMARVFHQPLLMFYLETPPREENRGEDFRTLPRTVPQIKNAQVDALLRDILVKQQLIKSALEEDEESNVDLTYVGSVSQSLGTNKTKERIIDLLQFDLHKFRHQKTIEASFKYLRTLVENLGIFVVLMKDLGSYHTQLDLSLFRGFTIADKTAPFIVINQNDAKSAWSYTLLHELTHIFLGQTGISNQYSKKQIELYCDAVASTILLPTTELDSFTNLDQLEFDALKEKVSSFAYARKLSSTMVAYNLYLKKLITEPSWNKLRTEFFKVWQDYKTEEKRKFKESDSGPQYTILKNFTLGRRLVSTVDQLVSEGFLSTSNAYKVLGISSNSFEKIIELNTL